MINGGQMAKLKLPKNAEKVIEHLEKNGWEVTKSRSKHFKVAIKKDGFSTSFSVSSTPSSDNATKSMIAEIRTKIRLGGFNTLDKYNSYLVAEQDILDFFAGTLNGLVDKGGDDHSVETTVKILQFLVNCSPELLDEKNET